MGDLYRELREFKRDMRTAWHECPSSGCQFGGNPVKVAPGCKCRHCGWRAPGKIGDDKAAAYKLEAERHEREQRAKTERDAKRAKRTCPLCRHVFGSPAAMQAHLATRHRKRMGRR
jgi:ferredoxin